MKKYFLTYFICSFICVLTIPLVAQEDCGDTFEAIRKLYEEKNWKAAKTECLSYLRHCGSSAQVEQILKESEEHIKPTPKPQPKPISKPVANKRFSVSEKYLEFPNTGGNKKVVVTADGAWDIYNYPGWLEASKMNNTLLISCEANYYASAREDDVILVDENLNEVHISVFQDRNSEYLRLSANLIHDQDGDGGVFTVNVSSSKLWRVKNNLLWCKVETSTNEIRITLDKNNSDYERKGEIEVVSQSGDANLRSVITVKQSVLKNYLTLSNTGFTDPTGRGCLSLPIKVETDCGNFRILNVPSWCEVEKNYSSFTVRILKNCGGGERTAQLKVVAGDQTRIFTIRQVARYKYVDVNPDVIITATNRGGYQKYTVNTNCGAWHVVNLPAWCLLEEQTSDSFTITILPNEGAPRTATFAVSSSGERCNMTIKQE